MKIQKSSSTPFQNHLIPASQTVVGRAYVGPTSREVLVRLTPSGHTITAKQRGYGLLPFAVLRTGALRMVSPDAKLAVADATVHASAADGGSISQSST